MVNITEEERIEVFYNYLYGDTSGKIVLISNLIISSIIGPTLMIGIVIFEVLGGDSQKRTILNRLLSACLINAAISFIGIGIMRVIRDAFGLFDYNIALTLRLFIRFFGNSAYIYYNVLTIFRYLFIVVWKRMRGVQDKFWSYFIWFSVCVFEMWHICVLFMSNFDANDGLIINLALEPVKNATFDKENTPANGRLISITSFHT